MFIRMRCFAMLAHLLFLFGAETLIAQPEHYNWLLDGDVWIDFSTGSPVVREPLEFSTIESAAAISDSEGNLLFYTNGVEVHNRLGEVISELEVDYNDTTFFKSLTQGVLILPGIGQPNKFLIIGIGRYATVDMTLNGGLGGMDTLPSWRVFDSDTLSFGEKNVAIRHANGRDWWILQHRLIRDYENDRYDSLVLSYLYDDSGISLIHKSRINLRSSGIASQYGEMAVCPSGDKVGIALINSIVVYDFDRCQGTFGNELLYIDSLSLLYGCAFSPSGKYLYVSTNSAFGTGDNILYQISLVEDQFGDRPITEVFRRTNYGLVGNGQLELAPDGKIYMTTGCRFYNCQVSSILNTSLSVINSPDLAGLDCNFDTFSISLGTKTWFALPNMVNYALGPLEGSECDTLGGGSTAVPETVTLPQWQITPTVSSGWFSFSGPEQAMLMVYDVWGRTVWQGTAAGLRIDLSAQPTGLYLVQAQWEEKQQTFRVIKQ